jgi:hypothetical protein
MSMQLKLITVAFDPELGGFPANPLSAIEGDVVNVIEHFFQHGGLPHLLLVAYYRPARDTRDGRGSIPPRHQRPTSAPSYPHRSKGSSTACVLGATDGPTHDGVPPMYSLPTASSPPSPAAAQPQSPHCVK